MPPGNNPGTIINGDFFLEPNPFFAGVHCGNGKYFGLRGANGDHDAVNLTLPQNEPKGVLYMIFGSYLSDFNMATNNIYRATLATANYGLVTVAMSNAGPSPWRFESTGLDEHLGSGIVRTINEAGANCPRWIGMMGDPTLHMHTVIAPSNCSIAERSSRAQRAEGPVTEAAARGAQMNDLS
jgi:hypothetical protein